MPATKTRRPVKKKTRAPRMIYAFGRTKTDGDATQKNLLGGKGANLAEMTSIGLPVPPGFTITTSTCKAYNDRGNRLPDGLMSQVKTAVRRLERETGKQFGSTSDPLLVSVRSGAAESMPGMMETVLNLGLNDASVEGLAKLTGNRRFAFDAYRRLINMFGSVVFEIDHHHFEAEFDAVKKKCGVTEDTDVPVGGLEDLCTRYEKVFRKHAKIDFPQDPYEQLQHSIEAVFRSWSSGKAIAYRQINEITGLAGTAVNVQTMVFGNMGTDSGTGVAFTRDPSTGKNEFYGEFLINAQGEDVVAGIRTPQQVKQMPKWNKSVFDQLMKIRSKLEKHFREVQDIEFTIERGHLWMLQTRRGKRTAAAAVRIAVDMVDERLISRDEALMRVPAGDLVQLLLPSYSAKDKKGADIIARGLPASPGASCGRLAFSAEEATRRTQAGEQVILVRRETSPEDVEGMHHAVGILTSTGGMTSHAAVVARGWGKCCVAGAGDLEIDEKGRKVRIGKRSFGPKDTFSIDGSTGEVIAGVLNGSMPKMSKHFGTLMKWADAKRRMKVRTNADSPADSKRARQFGAEGIGLTRTEHMFFDTDRITNMRKMILATSRSEREKVLKKLLPYQRKDFIGIFTAMKGLPVTVRLLDPPLHEFLPNEESSVKEVAASLGVKPKEVRRLVAALHESNPMLGHRGCRLAVTYPEILRMQVTAIVEAMIACKKKKIDARPEIMIPLVGTKAELELLRAETLDTIAAVKKAKKYTGKLDIPVGTMIEIPRAAVTADEVAECADFFSFGTNDLTQLTFGYSRDDINGFLPDYLHRGILEKDPFQSIDVDGVGALVETGCKKGRMTKPTLKLGVCGEHGGDPASIQFFESCGLDYVSCSPFRVPTARLAAAQAVIRGK
ncbi:MAG: pyruvate, phosphate dikinase [Phycisphaerales bacterium]|jgi:pyruvate,orthophosphate dikinase|nr:pyruvate, phosphate dikinase [Phycisphaerales bacterium]